MNIYEKFGRVSEQLETEQQNHRDTVMVLADLKAGRLRLDQVDVDEANMSWAVHKDREQPEPIAEESKHLSE